VADPSESERLSREFEHRLFQAARLLVGIGALVAAIFAAASADSVVEGLSIGAMAVAVAFAAGVLGALLGFLFGIPRTLQRQTANDDATHYVANTNLEQISDWLTKIIVGVTLIQIGHTRQALGDLADALHAPLGDRSASGGFGLALSIFSATSAFLLAYLWTRVRLHRELAIADSDIEGTVRKVVDLLAKEDALALSLLDRQLSGQNPASLDELAAALGRASESTLVQVYQRAEDVRVRTWREAKELPDHDRTIAVFRALIANDADQRFHRHFGSLGFALKDAKEPDLPGSLENLTIAIRVRGDPYQWGFLFYEWNRAVVRILLLDQPYENTPPDVALEIVTDLRAAATRLPPRFFNATNADDDAVRSCGEWLQSQGLDYTALRAPVPS
jgi:hypothetical protein